MNVVTLFPFLCLAFIGSALAVDCNDDSCVRFCGEVPCPTLGCGNAETCTQWCQSSACGDITCSAGKVCEQVCHKNCTSKMVCSSPTCFQTCETDSCEMECASTVKECNQICKNGALCEVTCNKGTTNCHAECENATCTGNAVPTPPPKQVSSCDTLIGKCTKSCKGVACKGKTLSCGAADLKECTLSCDGCKMECGSRVQVCNQTCLAGSSCERVCDARTCIKTGKFHSSAVVCQLNYLMFALFACAMFSILTMHN